MDVLNATGTCAEKMVKVLHFMLCVFYHNKKRITVNSVGRDDNIKKEVSKDDTQHDASFIKLKTTKIKNTLFEKGNKCTTSV